MGWLAVDKDLEEYIFDCKPDRFDCENDGYWDIPDDLDPDDYSCIELPFGSIEKLIGKVLTWEDDPVEIY